MINEEVAATYTVMCVILLEALEAGDRQKIYIEAEGRAAFFGWWANIELHSRTEANFSSEGRYESDGVC